MWWNNQQQHEGHDDDQSKRRQQGITNNDHEYNPLFLYDMVQKEFEPPTAFLGNSTQTSGALILPSMIRPLVVAGESGVDRNQLNLGDHLQERHESISNKQVAGSTSAATSSSQHSFLCINETGMIPANKDDSLDDSMMMHQAHNAVLNPDYMLSSGGERMNSSISSTSATVRSTIVTKRKKGGPHGITPFEDKELPYHALHFPWRLHQMLEAAESHGFSHIVSWLPEHEHDRRRTNTMREISEVEPKSNRVVGTPFKVHEPEIFENVVMPRFFRQTKFKSFRRQINLWSFERIRSGPNKGGYQNDYFVRTKPSLCACMRRAKSKRLPREDEDEMATTLSASSSVEAQEIVSGHSSSSPRLLGKNCENNDESIKSIDLAGRRHISTTEGERLESASPPTRSGVDPSMGVCSSWLQSHETSLLSYACSVLQMPPNEEDRIINSRGSKASTDDIHKELISTFCISSGLAGSKEEGTVSEVGNTPQGGYHATNNCWNM